jgi:hypothetical protein
MARATQRSTMQQARCDECPALSRSTKCDGRPAHHAVHTLLGLNSRKTCTALPEPQRLSCCRTVACRAPGQSCPPSLCRLWAQGGGGAAAGRRRGDRPRQQRRADAPAGASRAIPYCIHCFISRKPFQNSRSTRSWASCTAGTADSVLMLPYICSCAAPLHTPNRLAILSCLMST